MRDRVKRLIMENLPRSQKGKNMDSLYVEVNYDIESIEREKLSREDFLSALESLNEEQSLVLFRTDDIKGTNYGFTKYGM